MYVTQVLPFHQVSICRVRKSKHTGRKGLVGSPHQSKKYQSGRGSYESFVSVCVCAQSCLTLWGHMDYSLPGSSVHGIFLARILERVCHFLLQGIFLIQGLNSCLLCPLHDRQILYHGATGEAHESFVPRTKNVQMPRADVIHGVEFEALPSPNSFHTRTLYLSWELYHYCPSYELHTGNIVSSYVKLQQSCSQERKEGWGGKGSCTLTHYGHIGWVSFSYQQVSTLDKPSPTFPPSSIPFWISFPCTLCFEWLCLPIWGYYKTLTHFLQSYLWLKIWLPIRASDQLKITRAISIKMAGICLQEYDVLDTLLILDVYIYVLVKI